MDAINILVVDDETTICTGYRYVIESRLAQCRAFAAFSGEETLEIMCETPVDVLITDIRMPGMDGIRLIKRAKSMDPDLETLVISAHEDFNYAVEAMRLSAAAHRLVGRRINAALAGPSEGGGRYADLLKTPNPAPFEIEYRRQDGETLWLRISSRPVCETVGRIYANAQAMEQIFINLLINAAQAMDKVDSRIRVRVTVLEDRPDRIIIEVEDNGRSMDAEVMEKIFDPFFTTKPMEEGAGLGLYICHNLIQGIGGDIRVRSAPGVGATVQVILNQSKEKGL